MTLQHVQTAINTLQTSFQRKLSVILTHEAGVGYKGLGEDQPAGRVQEILKEENMTENSFETHEALRTLQRAGFEAVQAQAVVDVVTRAPISTQVVKDLERIKVQVETNMATKTDLTVLEGGVAQLETNMATKADLADLRASLFRALWLQGGAYAALIIGLAGLVVAGS